MYKGGSNYATHSAQIIRFAGLLVPTILIIYGVFVQTEVIKVPHVIDTLGLFLLSFWWMYIGILQFLFPSKTVYGPALRLIAYHLIAGAFLVFITGVSSPFITCWILLMLASYIGFSKRGLQLSALAFIIIIAIDIILQSKTNDMAIVYDLIALISILITGAITLGVYRSQKINKEELNRSKAQESLQRDSILTIINNLADAILSTDMDGIIRIYNAASLNLLDTNDNLTGRHIDEVLPLMNKDNTGISLFKEFQKTKTVVKRDDLNYSFSDGEEIRLEITYSPIRSSYSRSKKSETHDGYIIIMRDVTKAKSLEEERDEFISVTSHELRTPVTIAEGTLSNVQVMMDHPNVTKTMLKDSVNLAHDQIIFLASMVNDLSTLSRAERGVADSTEDIDIREMAHEMLNKYTAEAKAKKLHLNLDLAPKLSKVRVSRLYLEELLQNFITNAIKYTKKGSVTIIIEQKDSTITFSVKDTGIGISKPDQSKVFEKFYRSEDYRTRETGGTGLGLYIAAKLAHKLGTKIQLTSRLNLGSTFGFELPESKDN